QNQHPNLGFQESWKPLWTVCPGVPIGCRSPRKRGPYSMPNHNLAKVVVAAGSREPTPMEPVHGTPKASPSAGGPVCPSLHLRERSSSMKNRKRETCTSGTVRDEDGNILIYSAGSAI